MKNWLPNYLPLGLTGAFLVLGSLSMTAQTFPSPGFTLPPGKTIVITYAVDVNPNVCPTGTLASDISNQATVMGSNFPMALSNDPDNPAPDPAPTLTPVASLTLGNLVYRDNNKDGMFDGGDAGVFNVALKLYADDGDGVLDAGDTERGTTFTDLNGLYTFTGLCPGDYIVEVLASNFNAGGPLYDNGLMAALVSSPVGGAPDPDNNTNNDDNGDPVGGFGVASAAITLSFGGEPTNDGDTDANTNLTLDFGFKTPTTIMIDDVTMDEGTGGATTAFNFTVTRSSTDEMINLTVNTAPGTAVSPDDFTAISGGTVMFTASGSPTAMVTVLVNHDNVVEDNETFTVMLSGAPAGIILLDATGEGTIDNDDEATLTLSGGAMLGEDDAGTVDHTFTATLSAPVQGGFQIAYTTGNGTATPGSDYTDNDGTLTFDGDALEEQSFTVQANGDLTVELDETFEGALGAISATSMVQAEAIMVSGSPRTSTIVNDDEAVVSLAGNVSQDENMTPQVFTVNLSQPVDVPVTVQFSTANNSAVAPGDFMAISNQEVFFAPNTTTGQVVNVTIANESIVENDELYDVSLGGLIATGRDVTLGTSSGTGTIENDDLATVTLSGGQGQNEGNTGTTSFTFTAKLDNPVQGGFSVAYTTDNGTAMAGSDYQDNDGMLTFDGTLNEMETITVLVNGDFIVEPNETFTVSLGAVSAPTLVQQAAIGTAGSPQTGTINNDETDYGDAPASYGDASHAAVLGFSLGAAIDGDPNTQSTPTADGDDTDAEGDDEDGVTLPAILVTATMANVTVNASAAGQLDAWVDFNDNGNFGDFGENVLDNVTLSIGNNNLSFAVPSNAVTGTSFARFRFGSTNVPSPTGAAPDGEVEDYQVVIQNTVLNVGDVTKDESNAGMTTFSFEVSLNNPAPVGGVTFDIATANGSATTGGNDYVAQSLTSQVIPEGLTSYTFDVMVNGDNVVEENETFFVNVTNVVGVGVGDPQGLGTITNDDLATVTLAPLLATQDEGNGGITDFTFTATLNNDVQDGFSLAYTTDNGTALAGDDYNDNDASLSFDGMAGEVKTITVQVLGDTKVEANQTFSVVLGAISGPAGVTTAGSPQTGTIRNDDAATLTIVPASVGGAANEGTAGAPPFTFNNLEIYLSHAVEGGFLLQFSVTGGTATLADNDYNVLTPSPLGYVGNANEFKTITIQQIKDSKVEADETLDVTLTGLTGTTLGGSITFANSPQTLTILNDDMATVTLTGGISQSEGNSGTTPYTFTATLNNPVQGGLTVAYTTNNGTAAAGSDYQDNDGMLTFDGAMNEEETITVLVNGDLLVEDDETFNVALGAISGGSNPGAVSIANSPQTGVIVNDEVDYGDAPDPTYPTLLTSDGPRHGTLLNYYLGAAIDGDLDGQPSAAADGDDTDAEGNDDDGVTFTTAMLPCQTAGVTVTASAEGLLNAWVDFSDDGDFNDPGETIFFDQLLGSGANLLTFTVPCTAVEGTTFARFRFSSGGGLSPTGAAVDGEVEDYEVQIVNTQFSIDDPTVVEGNAGTTNLVFTISRSTNATAASVNYAITGGTATTADGDYQVFAGGTASFAMGGAYMQTVTVVVNGDTKVELNETVVMTLSSPVNGPSVAEGDAGTTNLTFDISMSNPSDADVSFNFATQNGSATLADNDYQSNNGSHTLTPGQTMKQVTVLVNGDCTIESNETVQLLLSSLSNNGRNVSFSGGGPTLTGTGTIQNDDAAPGLTCPNTFTQGTNPGQCQATVTIPLPTPVSPCGTVMLQFRHRPVNGSNVPTGPWSGWFPSAGNTLTFGLGRYEVEWSITDDSGSGSCTFYFDVADQELPMITQCSGGTVTFNGQASLPVTNAVTVQATDNCGLGGTTYSPATITCSQVGQTVPVIATVTDVNGNIARCTTSVQVGGLPCGFTDGGGIGCSSQAAYNSGTFTLQTNNCNYSNPYTDNQGFIGYQLCGNGSISFRVASVSSTQVFAGISLRASTAPGAIKAEVVQNLYFTARVSVRTVTNGAAWPQNQFLSGQPWMRLDRQGSQVSIYTSADGVNWNILLVRTLTLPSCVQVGMLAYGPGAATATFNDVKVNGLSLLAGATAPAAASDDRFRLPPSHFRLQVYPNPTSGQLTVELPAELPLAGATLEVLDAYGRSLFRETALDYRHELQLGNLPAGTYFVRLLTAGGATDTDSYRGMIERVVVQP